MPCAPTHVQPRKLVEAGPRAASPLLHAHKADGAVGATPEDGGKGLSSGLLMPTCNYIKRSAAIILSCANSGPAPLPQHAITFQLGLLFAREAQVTDTGDSELCSESFRRIFRPLLSELQAGRSWIIRVRTYMREFDRSLLNFRRRGQARVQRQCAGRHTLRALQLKGRAVSLCSSMFPV